MNKKAITIGSWGMIAFYMIVAIIFLVFLVVVMRATL